jgi:hypothetical protein
VMCIYEETDSSFLIHRVTELFCWSTPNFG